MRTRTLFGAAAAVMATMAVTGTAAADAAGSTGDQPSAIVEAATAPPAYPAVSGTWPTEWPAIADYTNTIAIAVPPTWSQMEIMPALNDDGSPRPYLAASPSFEAFLPAEGTPDTFSVPGAVFVAYPGVVDTAATVAASEFHDTCVAQPVQTFQRGALTGHLQEFASCGGTGTRIVYVAATVPGAAETYLLLVQLTGAADDAAVLDGILSSFSPTTVPG